MGDQIFNSETLRLPHVGDDALVDRSANETIELAGSDARDGDALFPGDPQKGSEPIVGARRDAKRRDPPGAQCFDDWRDPRCAARIISRPTSRQAELAPNNRRQSSSLTDTVVLGLGSLGIAVIEELSPITPETKLKDQRPKTSITTEH